MKWQQPKLTKAFKQAREKLRQLALKTHAHAATYGHEMLWQMPTVKLAIGTCANCNQKVEVVNDGRKKHRFIGTPKKCPGKLNLVPDTRPYVPGEVIEQKRPRMTTTFMRTVIVRGMPTPNPRGFPKVSPIEGVIENAKVYGFQPRNRWEYVRDNDTRPRSIAARKRKQAKEPVQYEMRSETRR